MFYAPLGDPSRFAGFSCSFVSAALVKRFVTDPDCRDGTEQAHRRSYFDGSQLLLIALARCTIQLIEVHHGFSVVPQTWD